MPVRAYDTRSREKRELGTLVEGEVGIYVCGITPYSPSHIGHARQAIAFDIIVRWLRKRGYRVNYITNFTDIDDKIIDAANKEGVGFLEVADRHIEEYFEVMDAMNVQRADAYPRVTETIPEIIDMVTTLIDRGHAYVGDDGVYFEIDTAPEKFGQLTGQTLEMVRAGAGGRVADTGSGKRDHRDFALWKLAKRGEPSWDSPWGSGRPGWHIECSAMSLSHLGEAFDIHGGGSDLMFPHHEAEIFQSEFCLCHEPVVHFWMHNGMINVDGEKMSKSLGNFWTIRDAFGKVDPLELRYAMINAPYRQPVEFNSIMLEDACMHQRRLVAAFSEGLSRFGSSDWSASKELSATAERLSTGMDDDFNTRVAIVEVQSVVRNLRGLLDSNEPDEGVSAVVGWLSEFAGRVLGLLPDEGSIAASLKKEESARSEIAECVEALLSKREDARESKDWGSADSIRDELSTMGVVVEDGPEGPTWRLG